MSICMEKGSNSFSKCMCKLTQLWTKGEELPCPVLKPRLIPTPAAQHSSETTLNPWETQHSWGPVLNSGKHNGLCKELKIAQLYLGSLVIEPSSIPSVNMWFPNFQDLTAAVRSCQLCPLLTALWLKYLKRLHNPQRQFIPTFLCLM